MNALTAVFRRELAEHRGVLLASLALGLIPLAAPWLPGLSGHSPGEARATVALVVAAVGGPLLALLLGSGTIARELGEGRLGFFFARPIPAWALWLGKVAAVTLVTMLSLALFVLPTVADVRAALTPENWGRAVWLPLAALAAIVLAQAVAIAARARSAWLLLDVVALTLLVPLGWTTIRTLTIAGAYQLASWTSIGMGAVAVIALGLGGLATVSHGRTDLRRAHRAQAIVIWSLVGAGCLSVAAYGRWVLAATPQDLTSVTWVEPAPIGSWIALSGTARERGGWAPDFLLDTASGRHLSLGVLPSIWREGHPLVVFSADGRRAAWTSYEGRATSIKLVDLESGKLLVDDPIDDRLPTLALDADGQRLFITTGRRLLIRDARPEGTAREILRLPEGSIFASLETLPEGRVEVSFNEPGRAGEDGFRAPIVWRVDPDTGARETLPRPPVPPGFAGGALSEDGTRRLMFHADDGGVALVDAATGTMIREIPTPAYMFNCELLHDGSLVLLRRDGDARFLLLIDRDGADRARLELSPALDVRLRSEWRPGHLLVAIVDDGSKAWPFHALDVDLATGRTQSPGGRGPVRSLLFARNLGAERYFVTDAGELVEIDPVTEESRTILRGLSTDGS